MTNTVFDISPLWDYAKADGDVSTSVNEVLMCPLLNTEQDGAKLRVTCVVSAEVLVQYYWLWSWRVNLQ